MPPTTPESAARTRAFARVMGPFLTIVPATIALRLGQMDVILTGFFETPVLPWITGAILLFLGLMIIAHHQIWSSGPAIVISLIGWLFALRGIALLAMPEVIGRLAASSMGATTAVRIGFGVLAAVGLWLTYAGWIAREPSTA